MSYQLDESGCRFIAAREALVLSTYADSHSPAIGFGLNDPLLKPGDSITVERACELLVERLKKDVASLERTFNSAPLKQQQINALLSLQYNIGSGGVRYNAPLVIAVKALSADQNNKILRDKAGFEILKANYTQDKGPFNLSRRCREALIFTAGDYGDCSKLMMWGPGKNPRTDAAEIIDMPTFLKAQP